MVCCGKQRVILASFVFSAYELIGILVLNMEKRVVKNTCPVFFACNILPANTNGVSSEVYHLAFMV